MKSTRIFLLLLLLLLLPLFLVDTDGFGSMGAISAAFGDDAFFCAIDASGRQTVICWSTKKTALMAPSASSSLVNTIPPMAALSGGQGFLCGILANTSQAYCWTYAYPGKNLVQPAYRTTAYSHIAAGKAHACGIRGSYYSDHDSGTVDCWEIILRSSNYTARSGGSSTWIYAQSISNLVFKKVVAGEGFSCGIVREGGIVCWGPNATSLGVSAISDSFAVLASGKGSLCGILDNSSMVKCWGDTVSAAGLPSGIGFTSLTAGSSHFCGIRKDNHEVECWGTYNSSQIPKGSGFSVIASSDFSVCGIREVDLVLDCWFPGTSSIPSYDPPLELCSPGLCMARSCSGAEFAFNASILNEPDLSSLCLRRDLSICSPCGSNCSEGFFLSSPCTNNSDRVCSRCSLCQNTSCSTVCGLPLLQEMQQKHLREQRRLLLIAGCSASGFLILLICSCLITRSKTVPTDAGAGKQFQFVSCVGKIESKERTNDDESIPALASVPSVGLAQIFRLVELKHATNGFKEFNEVGRGSYGFVYKAVLPDGRPVAVKRANAATIIHTNSREYEMELEILCKLRHSNIVNLLGYCSEMGERILVYEFMQHGTLYDHLHGGLSPLNWTLRLRISMQAAKGLEYLHKEVTPTMVHRDVKTSHILLDSDWIARIADFGLVISSEKDLNDDLKVDIYSFGVVLLEILSGRKAYDIDYSPPDIVGWAAPQIKKGRGAAIIDRNVTLPRNVEPLLKLADMAELAVREDPNERPTISEISLWLEQIVKDGLVF